MTAAPARGPLFLPALKGGVSREDQDDGGDWTHLTIDLRGFAAGTHLSLLQQPIDGYSTLSVQDAATGTLRVLDLTGGAPRLDQLHIVWS